MALFFAMNIFYIDRNPIRAAQQHVDRHVCKMPIELAQMLSTAHHRLDGETAPGGIYKEAYPNHPCSVWLRETRANYEWAYIHYVGLLNEYTIRYGKHHASGRLSLQLSEPPRGIPEGRLTPPAQAMPDQYRAECPLTAYRAYYRHGKAHLHKWKVRKPPEWLTN